MQSGSLDKWNNSDLQWILRNHPEVSCATTILNGLNIVSITFGPTTEFVSQNIATGCDYNFQIAFAKAISEFIERKVAKRSKALFSGQTKIERTDGFAAMPKRADNAQERARQNAVNEATERFCWVRWWEDKEIFYTDIPNFEIASAIPAFMNLPVKFAKPTKIFGCEIPIGDIGSLVVLIAKIQEGYLCGGAFERDRVAGIRRAYCELVRHVMGFERMCTVPSFDSQMLSFYEQRVYLAGRGDLNAQIESRLNFRGTTQLKLPELQFDQQVFDDFYCTHYVHRSLYFNQPYFIGGPIEKFYF